MCLMLLIEGSVKNEKSFFMLSVFIAEEEADDLFRKTAEYGAG